MVTVSKGDSYITLYPSETLKISCGVDCAREAPIIGRQWFSWAPFEDEHYRWIISPARTFFTSMKVSSPLPSTTCTSQGNGFDERPHRHSASRLASSP